MFFSRPARRKSSSRVSKLNHTRRRKLFLEPLEDRRVLAYIMGGASTPANTSGWQWDAANMSTYRAAIQNAANFGPGGVVSTSITTVDVPNVDAAALAPLDGFISSWWADSQTPAAAVNDTINAFLGGMDLFLLQDDSGHDLIGQTLGIPTAGFSDGSPSNDGPPLFSGPFGSAVNVTQAGSVGFLSGGDISAKNGNVGGTNGIGQITSAYWDKGEYAPGAGRLVIMADVDMVSAAFGNVSYTPPNDNGRFALNATAFIVAPSGTLSATISGGSLIITDTDAAGENNNLTASVSGSNFVITDANEQFDSAPPGGSLSNGNRTLTVPLGLFSNIIVNTMGGNDLLTVNSSMATSGRPITFSGGLPSSGPPGDAMVISGPGTFGNVTHSFTSASDGSVSIDGYVVSYTGLEPVTDTLTATTRTFTFTGGAETVTLADSGAAGDTLSIISSTLGESVTFANPTGTLTVNLNGADILNFNNLDSMEAGPAPFSADLVINGDGGDTVNFSGAMINLGAGTANIGTGGGIQTINFTGGGLQTTGSVFLTAAGAIGNTTVPVEIIALNLVAIGGAGVNLDTTITNLEASGGSGGVDIQETDALIIGGVSAPVVGVSATGGNISIVATGNITVNEAINNSGGGNVVVTDVGSGGGGGAYTQSTPAFNLQDIGATGNFVGLSDDQVSGAVPIGFNFNFFGTSYSSLFISSNGFLTVLPSQSNGCCSGSPIPNPGNPNGIISAYWNDLFPPGAPAAPNGGVFYQTQGAPGSREFLVQYKNVANCCNSTPAHNFEIKLFETSNVIEFHYSYVNNDGSTGSAGIENQTGTVGNQFFFGSADIPDNTAVRYTPGGSGAAGDTSINANISASGGNGNVILTAGEDILHNSGVVSATGSGLIDYNAGAGGSTGVITMANGTSASSGSGLVTMDADGDIRVTTISTSGNVTINTPGGSILDDSLASVIAGNVVSLTAGGEIGQPGAADIDTSATSLSAIAGDVSGFASKGIWITETDAVTITNATTTDGVILIDAGTALTAASVTASGIGRNVRLRALGGNLNVGSVTAAGDIVSLSATGAITDGDAANDVSALSLMMSAGSGIAAAGDPLETVITHLAWSSGSGGAFVANTGALTIGSVTAFGSTITGGAGSGAATISAASPLTVAANVIMGGAVSLTAGESATDDVDNLTVNAGVTVQSTGSSVTLNSGDDTTISSTSSILAATTVTINIDSGDLDATGETLTIASGAVVTAPGGATFNGGAQADTFNFAPQPIGTAIVVNGNAPIVIPGDVLNLDLAGATGTTLTIDGTNDGTFTFSNRASVEYNSIEDVNALGGCYDLVLNMPAFGASGDFTVRRGIAFVGTTLEIVNNAGPTVVFSADLADIASLQVNGTAGSDSLTVDDVNGLVAFDPLCIPTAVFPDNGNLAGVARLFFDGAGAGADVDQLNFQLTEKGTSQAYAIGNGAGPGSDDGEVFTDNGQFRSLTTYFRNLGPLGSVNRTGTNGANVSTLDVIGDANANTLTVTAAAGLTTVNPAGYTPFTFAPGANFSQMTLQGAGGNDTYHINGAGAAGLDNLLIPAIVTDSAGTDALFVNDSTDTTGDTATITQVGIDGLNSLAGNEISFSGMETLDVTATAGADTLTTNLGGAVANPTDFAGLVTVNVRGNGDNDTLFLHVADSLGDASLNFVTLFGDLGGDTFGSAADKLNPVLRTGQTQIAVHGGIAAATPGPGIAFNPFAEPGDKLFLDMTSTFSGTLVTPIVIVDTNGGNADSANTQTFRFTGIEDIDLYDNGVLTNTAIGDFFLRATDQADYIQFTSAAQVNPVFRVRVGNLYYPTNGGMYGPYTTGTSKVYAYGRGGNDTITMYNTRLNGAIFGEGGDDILTGGYGNDLIVGGVGNDRLSGGNVGGNDEVWGDDFNPAIDVPSVASQTGSGNDQINTFGGADTVYGQGGNDIINTGAGDDYINGGPGGDQIDGQSGNDRIYGGSGADTLTGSDGNDIVVGNDGNDALYGRTGNDIVIGGLGQDIVNGNEGSDALVGDESNGAGSGSLASGDAADEALLALMLLWGPSPTLGDLAGFDSAGDDGFLDTLWGGAAADAFFGAPPDNAADRNAVGYGPDLN